MIDEQYKTLLKEVLEDGFDKNDRTGIGSRSIAGAMLKHDMGEGFPALTIRKVPFKSVRVELEGFIKGINSKKWYQERGCKLWNEWCNPQKVAYSNDPDTKQKMLEEDDLGLIYGNNWRDFHHPRASYSSGNSQYGRSLREGWNRSKGVDQLQNLVEILKKDPNSRRMLVTAWNPLAMDYAALPACHDSWQVTVTGGKLNLLWRQRSCDLLLGIPANIASYAILLHLLALESGLEEGHLIGFLGDVHLYSNQLDAAKEYLNRDAFELPRIKTKEFTSIFDWDHSQTKLIGYEAHDRIKVDVAV